MGRGGRGRLVCRSRGPPAPTAARGWLDVSTPGPPHFNRACAEYRGNLQRFAHGRASNSRNLGPNGADICLPWLQTWAVGGLAPSRGELANWDVRWRLTALGVRWPGVRRTAAIARRLVGLHPFHDEPRRLLARQAALACNEGLEVDRRIAKVRRKALREHGGPSARIAPTAKATAEPTVCRFRRSQMHQRDVSVSHAGSPLSNHPRFSATASMTGPAGV
jgi:hypothetical protein